MLWYEGGTLADGRQLYADPLGSIVEVSDASGNPLWTDRYDEYGIPQAESVSRFKYTGQAWFYELGMYYYKNRVYSPTLGRFLQTDPIGYEDNANLYAYVGNDPVNFVDPFGLCGGPSTKGKDGSIIVTGCRIHRGAFTWDVGKLLGGLFGGEPKTREPDGHNIIVTAKRMPKRGRDCSSFQKNAEEFADAAADISSWSFDLALGTEIGGRGLQNLGKGSIAKLGRRAAGPVAGTLFQVSAYAAGLSLIGYAASGQRGTALYNKAIQSVVDRTLGRFSGPAGKWLTDKVTSGAQANFDKNRCSK